MEFGIFDHLDRSPSSLADYYEERLAIVELFDRTGFHAYHLAEHHATPLGMAPSPSVFLAAVAQRTKRLRFGPMIYALPLVAQAAVLAGMVRAAKKAVASYEARRGWEMAGR